jgi:hypothetical protein
MKHIELTPTDWTRIRRLIKAEYGDSMILLRDKMRRELGFTTRLHTTWNVYEVDERDVAHRTHYYTEMIHVDFYSEEAKSWFLLKYT